MYMCLLRTWNTFLVTLSVISYAHLIFVAFKVNCVKKFTYQLFTFTFKFIGRSLFINFGSIGWERFDARNCWNDVNFWCNVMLKSIF
jgi:hypothetical protein